MIAVAHEAPANVAGYDPFRDAGECWYDAKAAQRAVDFFPNYLRHIDGRQFADKPLELQPWQADIIRTLFGWKRPGGMRRYRTCYVEVPRRNGKSTLAAGVALYLLACDGEAGAQVYSAAMDRPQATVVFRTAAAMVRKSPALSSRLRVLDGIKTMRYSATNSFYTAIAADAAGSRGFNAHGIIFDELLTQKNRGLWDTLASARLSREQPLTLAITTAGTDRLSICYEQHSYALEVRDGVRCDQSFLPVLYYAPDDADWQDEDVWRIANPNYGISPTVDAMRVEYLKAKDNPAEENKFRNEHLNQWTQQVTRYIPMHLWRSDANRTSVPDEELDQEPCWCGLDLAKTRDLTAFVKVFRRGEAYIVKPTIWLPAAAAAKLERMSNKPFEAWKRNNCVRIVPGNCMDYGFVREEILLASQKHQVQVVNYDQHNAHQLAQELLQDGVPMQEFPQTIVNFNEPMRELLDAVTKGRLWHGGHPVLDWNADCVEVYQNANKDVRPVKPDYAGPARIDAIVALVMGLAGAMLAEGPSVYETRGLRSVGGRR